MLGSMVASASTIDDIVNLRNAGDLAQAEEKAKALLQFSIEKSDTALRADTLYELGRNAMERNEYPNAHQYFSQANTVYQALGDELSIARTYREIGAVYRYQSDYPTALEYLYKALAIFQTKGTKSDNASIHGGIGVVLEKMGQFNEAAHYHQQSLEVNYELSNEPGIASDLYNLADIRRLLGDYALALDYFEQALVIDEASGNKKNIAYSCYKVGYVNMSMGNYALAEQYMQRAHALFVEIGAKRDIDWALTGLADLALQQGRLSEAETMITDIIPRTEKNGYKSLLLDAYQTLIDIQLEKERYEDALAVIDDATTLSKVMNERHKVSQLLALKVRALESIGDIAGAFDALKHQKQLDEQLFDQSRLDAIASTQAQTEFVRRANQIELLEQQKALQEIQSNNELEQRRNVLFGFVFLLLIGFLIYARRAQSKYTKNLEREVRARTVQLQRVNEELSALSLTDKLTELKNRRFIESHIDADIASVVRKHRQAQNENELKEADLCFFVIDLDYFKHINDNFGHASGDSVLQQTAKRLKAIFRESDYVVRWGGEEFVALARFINREDADLLAKRIVDDIQNTPFLLNDQEKYTVTCSVGFTCFPFSKGAVKESDMSTIFNVADHCLYAAKAAGRNQWVGSLDISDNSVLPLPTTLDELKALSQEDKIVLSYKP
jgi:diguanylate cyclase (GGDEF)-like protein